MKVRPLYDRILVKRVEPKEQVVKDKEAPLRSIIVGIIDRVDVEA